ncbi:MAG: RNA polymerase sigma factor [Opitutaceae bacterium]
MQPHESKLRGWLRARFPSLTDVDDLVQEAYARLVRARATGRVANPKSYLFAIARNAALDRFRHDHVISFERVEEIDRRSVLEETPNATEARNHTQDLELLAAAIQALPQRCRHVLVLQKIHGLSYQEIATRLGISERTVNAQIAKGVLRCRDYVRARQAEENQP